MKSLKKHNEMAVQGSSNNKIGNVPRSMRSIHPLGFRVVVKVRKEESMTDSGLYLPEGSKSALQESLLGEVVEVATAIDDEAGDDEEVNVSGIPAGALVLLPKDAGIRVPWDEDLRIVETEQILAIVSEVDIL